MLQKLVRTPRLLRCINSNNGLILRTARYTNIPIKLVPKRLHDHLFNRKEKASTVECDQLPSCSGVNGTQTYGQQGRGSHQQPDNQEDILDSIELPQLYGQDMMSHFEELGNQQFEKYHKIMHSVVGKDPETVPPLPDRWLMQTGWTAYDPLTGETTSVPFPDEQLLFFDVEICVLDGQLPTLAIALSPTKWYSWCSDRIVNGSPAPEYPKLEHLVPLEASQAHGEKRNTPPEKVIVGHNVAFDRSRVREQYFTKRTPAKYWDTMSMSIAICGMADHQRLIYEQSDASGEDSQIFKEGWIDHWRKVVCRNSLEAVHSKLCSASSSLKMDKSLQSMFVKDDIDEIRSHFQELTTYCANDVLATYEIFQVLYPEFRSRFPSSVTHSGMMEMSSAYLPINKSWRDFFDKCNRLADAKRDGAARDLALCAESLTGWVKYKRYEKDPWMWVSDWSTTKNNDLPSWYLNCFKDKKSSMIENEELEAEHMKMLSRDVPRILGMCYGPFPLFYKAAFGWGFLVPKALKPNAEWQETELVWVKRGDEVAFPNKSILDLIALNRANNVQEIVLRGNPVSSVGIFNFYKLPHPSGLSKNVGSVFSKDFADLFMGKVLWASRYEHVLKDFVEARSVTRFWSNYKERYHEQLAVWLNDKATVGAIAPSIVPAGTVTRRAVHKLWLVSANSKQELIGSDLKSMIQSYDGYKIVGADVDSQEQWIAAMFGDCAYGRGKAGDTPLSNMLLAGNKSNSTDLHSVVARQANISRDHAKVLNYARLYGSGENHAREFLKQQGISDKLAHIVTKKLFSATKGTKQRYFELDPIYNEHFKAFRKEGCPPAYQNQHIALIGYASEDQVPNCEQSLYFEEYMSKKHGKNLHEIFCNSGSKGLELYRNGFESYAFNYLELMSREPKPKTPILGCRLSKALEPLPSTVPGAWQFSSRYKRSIINWFVQSSAVDFLHMLLVCMNWLISEYDIDARLMLSIHDEVRYLVAEEDKYRCALALALSNMYVRSAISSKLGINQLPQSVAFFSQVDIDTVLRKEVHTKCVTPLGNEIPAGEAVDINQILAKTRGSLRRDERIQGERICQSISR
uniref:DNA-directed DNA polymerase n=1 Tax=Ditylenchus dipsaci TaxID=166011 RepID=A0A915D8M0_9BILA